MTDFVNDTFTDTNGTLIAAHTGEVGATWTREYTFPDVQWEINGNALRRQDYAGGSFDSIIHASGTPPTANYYVEVGIYMAAASFATLNNNWFEFDLIARGFTHDPGFGPVEDGVILAIDFHNGGFSNTYLGGRWSSGGGSITTMVPSVGDHVIRLEVVGNIAEAFYDGVSMGTQNVSGFTVPPTAPGYVAMGLRSASLDDVGDVKISYFKAGPLGPPPPVAFWQDFVNSAETDA